MSVIFIILTYLTTLLQVQSQFLSRFKNPSIYLPREDLSIMRDRDEEQKPVEDPPLPLPSRILQEDWDPDDDDIDDDIDPDVNVKIHDFGEISKKWDQYRPTKKWQVPHRYTYDYEEPKTMYVDYKEEPWPTITVSLMKTTSTFTTPTTFLQRLVTWKDHFPPLRKTILDRYQLTTPTAWNNTSLHKDWRKYEATLNKYLHVKHNNPASGLSVANRSDASFTTPTTLLQRLATWKNLVPLLMKTIPDRYQLTAPTAWNNTSLHKDGRKFEAALNKYLHGKPNNPASGFTAANRNYASITTPTTLLQRLVTWKDLFPPLRKTISDRYQLPTPTAWNNSGVRKDWRKFEAALNEYLHGKPNSPASGFTAANKVNASIKPTRSSKPNKLDKEGSDVLGILSKTTVPGSAKHPNFSFRKITTEAMMPFLTGVFTVDSMAFPQTTLILPPSLFTAISKYIFFPLVTLKPEYVPDLLYLEVATQKTPVHTDSANYDREDITKHIPIPTFLAESDPEVATQYTYSIDFEPGVTSDATPIHISLADSDYDIKINTQQTLPRNYAVDFDYEVATDHAPTTNSLADSKSNVEVDTQHTATRTYSADSDFKVTTQHTSTDTNSVDSTAPFVTHDMFSIKNKNEKTDNKTPLITAPTTTTPLPTLAQGTIITTKNSTAVMNKHDKISNPSQENTTMLIFLFLSNNTNPQQTTKITSTLKPLPTRTTAKSNNTTNTANLTTFSTTNTSPHTQAPLFAKTPKRTTTSTTKLVLIWLKLLDNTTLTLFSTSMPFLLTTTAIIPSHAPVLLKTPESIPTAMTKQETLRKNETTTHKPTRASTAISTAAHISAKMPKTKIKSGKKSKVIYPKTPVTFTHTPLRARVTIRTPKPENAIDVLYPYIAKKPTTGVCQHLKSTRKRFKPQKIKKPIGRDRDDVKDPANWKCYICGLNETKFGSTLCHSVFEYKDQRLGYKKRLFQKKCSGNVKYIGGCFKRFLDVGIEYNERGCRDWPPIRGNTYASKRLKKMEYLLKHVQEGCVTSPHAVLVPFSRAVSLFVRFHVCVCRGRFCNTASSVTPNYGFIGAAVFFVFLFNRFF